MRRIIERVVTVVTTTTWKISWEQDPLPSKPTTDPVSDELDKPNVVPHPAYPGTKELETKEVKPPETKT